MNVFRLCYYILKEAGTRVKKESFVMERTRIFMELELAKNLQKNANRQQQHQQQNVRLNLLKSCKNDKKGRVCRKEHTRKEKTESVIHVC